MVNRELIRPYVDALQIYRDDEMQIKQYKNSIERLKEDFYDT